VASTPRLRKTARPTVVECVTPHATWASVEGEPTFGSWAVEWGEMPAPAADRIDSPDLLFVYGTLRSQCRNRFARLLAEAATLLGPAQTRGRLYRIANYPGLVLSEAPDEWVKGELFRLQDAASLLPVLDDYEGCGIRDIPPFPFQRVIGEALQHDRTLGCWLYVYRATAGLSERQRIPSGDFFNSTPLDNG
jgi:gamma-glutamylcyclotransferase (GGCT)/AIG2-like uncharacterized protein YtfP